MIGVLLIGFWKLQVIDADKYSSLAERNRVRYIPVIAPRGRMLDRDGRVLVDNRPRSACSSFVMIRLWWKSISRHRGRFWNPLG